MKPRFWRRDRLRGAGWALAVLVGAAWGWAGFLLLSSWTFRPRAAERTPRRPDAWAAAEGARAIRLDTGNPLILHRKVDYTAGPDAAWYPKGEAPLCSELVRSGQLPPVAERVGPEPCVLAGVEGVGRYGGTWMRLATSEGDIAFMRGRLNGATLVRWSPYGYPIVPHVAKDYTISADNRTFEFALRQGMRWSDGHPFTADDILFWWEQMVMDPAVGGGAPAYMKVRGQAGRVEKIDDYRVRFVFPEPYGLFLAQLATYQGMSMTDAPAHYLKDFHPVLGDPEKIRAYMKARKLPNPLAVIRDVGRTTNPEHPRLWPWVCRESRSTPPHVWVRNPYYWVVDTAGNQLPYIDRVLFQVKSGRMIDLALANGEVSMQARHVSRTQYTLLMSMREEKGYEVFHWLPGFASEFVIFPNLNRRVDPEQPETRHKHDLLNERRFRQALSLAIDRDAIIRAEYQGQTRPSQAAPGPESFFYEPALEKSYVAFRPQQANALLDAIGLTRRDGEGFRTFPDGTRMTFFMDMAAIGGIAREGVAQFVVDDWARVGVRVIPRQRARTLFYTEKMTLDHDFSVWTSSGEFLPVVAPKAFVPMSTGSSYALGFAKWYVHGGLYGDPMASPEHGCIEPPQDHPLRRAMEVYEATRAESDPDRQREIFREALQIGAENVWSISVAATPPSPVVVQKGFRNVPRQAVNSWDFLTPANTGPETYFFESPRQEPGVEETLRAAILAPVLSPEMSRTDGAGAAGEAGSWLGPIIRWTILLVVLLALLLVAFKHPFIGRRLALMVPTLLVISVMVFLVIQLPPGDFLSTKIMQLEESGEEADLQQVEEMRRLFALDRSLPVRYAHWMGLRWFLSFDEEDQGLLQGHMGWSMESLRPVNEVVGDRILLTFLISLGTILFTWALALPIGIYSAMRQYSWGDYALSFAGFLGMCIPSFLLALLLVYFSAEVLGVTVTGLFSPRYEAQTTWTWDKVIDLLKHLWVPVVVLGLGGTAGMIRVMRANLLDELKKPYVVAARARGLRPWRLLLKYPVRIAINPFVSGIGGLFPDLVSGGAIVAIVLSLPTVGPLMLDALLTEDMYLAGSMLMVLSLLGVLGVLVSDLLLLWLDPRIRFSGAEATR